MQLIKKKKLRCNDKINEMIRKIISKEIRKKRKRIVREESKRIELNFLRLKI